MKIYKRKKIGTGAYGTPTYEYYQVDITDYVFIEHFVKDPLGREYILTPYICSRITGEHEILYTICPYTDRWEEICGVTARILEKYWKLLYRCI